MGTPAGRKLRLAAHSPLLVGTIVTARGLEKITAPRTARTSGHDLAEVRADALLKEGVPLDRIEKALRRRVLPVLLTCRIPAEGGLYPWRSGERGAVFQQLLPWTDAVDIELASLKELGAIVTAARLAKKKIVLSAHAIDKPVPPATLHKWVASLREAQPDVAKIAARIGSRADLQALARILLDRPPGPHAHWAVMGLGPHGALSRHIFSALGSALLYGYLDEPAAPGQPSAFALDRFRTELPR